MRVGAKKVVHMIPVSLYSLVSKRLIELILETKKTESLPTSLAKSILYLWQRDQLDNAVGIEKLLEAAHIIEWSKDPHNRLNPYNGLCLCSIHHKAFDLGWLIIDESLTIHWKPPKNYREIVDDAVYEYLAKYDGRTIIMPRKVDGLRHAGHMYQWALTNWI